MKFPLLLVLLTLIACGKGSSGSARRERSVDPLCGSESECAQSPAWVINSSAVNFPSKFQIIMDKVLVADSCRSSRAKITQEGGGRIAIRFNATYRPERIGAIEVIDQGDQCTNNAIYHSEDRPLMSVVGVTVEGRTTWSVSVTLGN